MLQLEIRRTTIYLTTDRKADILKAIEFLTKEYQSMEDRGTMQTTVYVTKQDEKVKTS